MSTTRWGPAAVTDRDAMHGANTGAQYVSAARGCAITMPLVAEAKAAGLLHGPLPACDVAPHSRCFDASSAPDDYAASKGTSAVARHFASAADTLACGARLNAVQRSGGGWRANVGRGRRPGWPGSAPGWREGAEFERPKSAGRAGNVGRRERKCVG